MLSCHPTALAKDASGKLLASAYARDWENPGSQLMRDHPKTTGREQLNTFDPHVVAKLVREFAWSPIVWAGGIRRAEAFASALWCALDFDDGVYTLAQALDDVTSAGLTHVIGTTKSHGKAKGDTPACDRFRLLLRFDRVVDSRALYERVMRAAMDTFPGCDKSCKDAARFFFPCVDIVSAANGYSFWPFDEDADQAQPGPAPPRKERSAYREAKNRIFDCDRMNRIETDFETYGAYDASGKHDKIKNVIPSKIRRGWSDEKIIDYIRGRTTQDKTTDEIRKLCQWWRDGGRYDAKK
jgi:hypothetical protein